VYNEALVYLMFAGSDIIICSSFQDRSLQTVVCDNSFSYLCIKLRLDVEGSIIFHYLKKYDSKMEKLMFDMTSDITRLAFPFAYSEFWMMNLGNVVERRSGKRGKEICEQF
jgi:hypothetical protein